jgi:hypothetical protein
MIVGGERGMRVGREWSGGISGSKARDKASSGPVFKGQSLLHVLTLGDKAGKTPLHYCCIHANAGLMQYCGWVGGWLGRGKAWSGGT